MIDNNKLKKFADDLSSLTFNMQKICNLKEMFFCKSINLTPIEFRCLRYLYNDNFLRVNELAKKMDLTPPRVTTLLNSLEKKEYIKRDISPNDRRIIKVALTNKGEQFAKEITDKYIDFHKEILDLVEDETQINDLLQNLNNFQNIMQIFLKNKI